MKAHQAKAGAPSLVFHLGRGGLRSIPTRASFGVQVRTLIRAVGSASSRAGLIGSPVSSSIP